MGDSLGAALAVDLVAGSPGVAGGAGTAGRTGLAGAGASGNLGGRGSLGSLGGSSGGLRDGLLIAVLIITSLRGSRLGSNGVLGVSGSRLRGRDGHRGGLLVAVLIIASLRGSRLSSNGGLSVRGSGGSRLRRLDHHGRGLLNSNVRGLDHNGRRLLDGDGGGLLSSGRGGSAVGGLGQDVGDILGDRGERRAGSTLGDGGRLLGGLLNGLDRGGLYSSRGGLDSAGLGRASSGRLGGSGLRGSSAGSRSRARARAGTVGHAGERDLGDVGALGRTIERPGHVDVGPADAAVSHGDHITSNVGVVRRDGLANLLALRVDELELGTGELALAAHGLERADRVGDLLPGDEGVGSIESSGVSVGAVVGTISDPVDLAVAVGGTDLRSSLLTDEGLLVREEGDGDVAVVGAVLGLGVALAHPVVEGQVNSTTGNPGEDVRVGANEASEGAVGATHSTHGLVAATVDGHLVGDLDAVVAHALGLSVEPDGTLVLSAEGGEGRSVGLLKGNTGVVGAAPRGGSTSNLLDLTVSGDVPDGITKVARGGARVGSDDDVGGVVAGLLGEDEVTVDIGRGKRVSAKAGATEEGAEGLLAVGVLVEDGEGVLGLSRDNLVGQEGKAVIVGNKTASLLTSLDGDGSANSGKGLGVNTLDVNTSTAGIEVGQVSGLAIGRDGEGSSAVVRETGPVSLLDGVERATQSQGVDVVLERGGGELSSRQRQAGSEGEKTRHGDERLV